MRRLSRFTSIAAVAVLAASTAGAQPVAAGIGAFTGATVVNFNSTANEAFVGSQYSGLGVTFAGSLYGMTNSGDLGVFPANGGGVIASNWLYSRSSNTGLSFKALFSAPAGSAGFWLENWANQTGTVEIFNSAVSLGTINFAPTSSLTAQFFGLTSVIGFDELRFTNTSNTNGFYAIDDFQFGASVTATPEPASILLMSTGLVGIVAFARRRRSA